MKDRVDKSRGVVTRIAHKHAFTVETPRQRSSTIVASLPGGLSTVNVCFFPSNKRKARAVSRFSRASFLCQGVSGEERHVGSL